MKRLIYQILTFVSGQKTEDSAYLMRSSIQLFVLYGFSIALGFLSNYILIKIAGVSDYGAYVYIFNLINLLANFCLLGVDTLLVKNISIYDSTSNYQKLKGILVFSMATAFAGSLIIAFIPAKAGFLFKEIENIPNINWYLLSFPALLFLSLNTLIQSSLQGLKKIVLSQVSEKLIRPLLLILIAATLFYLKKLTLTNLVLSNIFAIVFSFFVVLFFLYKHIGFKIRNVKPQFESKVWAKSALSFFLIGALYIINSRIDIFFLGVLKGNQQVGIYNIILRVSEIISFALVIINFVLAPIVASLFADDNLLHLQKVVTRSARVVLLIGLPLLLLIVVFRNYILIFFGVNFMNASEALLILSFGQFMNIFFGSVGTLLIMAGKERFSILSLAISTVIDIILNVMLIPTYGIIGAAIATSGSLMVWNFLMYFFVRRKLNIRTTATGII